MMKKIIIITLLITALFSERGDLISYEFKGTMNSEEIQDQLDSEFGSLSPEALFSIEMYSIVYETIDQFGNETIASGLVAYPIAIENAFPIMSFQHGTQIRRESAPSMGGFNELIMWLTTSGYIFVEPDYLGLGISNMLHPYHLKDVTASSVIDMVIATKHFCNTFERP